MTPSLVGLLVALAILIWPRRPGLLGSPDAGHRSAGAQCDASELSDAERKVALWSGGGARLRMLAIGSKGRGDGGEEVAEFAELLALCLRSGLSPREAIRIARHDGTFVHPRVTATADLLDGLHSGRPDTSSMDPSAGGASSPVGASGSHLLLSAWSLGLDCGAPLMEAVDAAAQALRTVAAAQRRAVAARAGPRASMRLLTLLPLGGPLAALAIGADPMATFGQPVALASMLTGLLLTAVGWWWSRRLITRAEAETVFS